MLIKHAMEHSSTEAVSCTRHLREMGMPWTSSLADRVAYQVALHSADPLAVTKQLRVLGIPWTEQLVNTVGEHAIGRTADPVAALEPFIADDILWTAQLSTRLARYVLKHHVGVLTAYRRLTAAQVPWTDRLADIFADHTIRLTADPLAAVKQLHAEGIRWTELAVQLATRYVAEAPGVLEFLIESGCPWSKYAVFEAIGQLSTLTWPARLAKLKWLWSRESNAPYRSCPPSLMQNAGIYSLKCLQWLHETCKAEWPDELVFSTDSSVSVSRLRGPPVRGTLVCWTWAALKYARARGASWSNWRCQHFDEGWYSEGADAATARAVFAWAHSTGSGCPCTCAKESAVTGAVFVGFSSERLWIR